MLNRPHIESILTDMVQIESINPDLVPDGAGEARIAEYVADFLRGVGLKTWVQKVEGDRANVIGILQGSGGGRSLMLNGHLDTVGVADMEAPFSARLEDGKLFGRGAQDMKGGLAAALGAVEALAKMSRMKGDLVLAAVADEEYKSAGTRALVEEIHVDAAIVMEPTGLEVATAHKGFAWAQIETEGRAAHGSRPQDGVDAIALMGRVLMGIESLEQSLESTSPHPLLGHGSVHASLISGGQELSSYPARCQLSLERRLLPGEDVATFESELREIISTLASNDSTFCARLTMGYSALAFETSRESPIAQALLASAGKVIGSSVKFGAQSFWTDAALLNDAGIACVLFGPGGSGMHSALEYVNLEDVATCAETLVDCAREFCNL